MGESQKLYLKAKQLIPGGTQLLSKRPEMFLPGLWPAYYSKAKGCDVWDLDGHKYVDMSTMGFGSCILGYADRDVNCSVLSVVQNASMTTLNAPQEVELARLLIDAHPWAHKARFARSGGEAMAIAVRIARAASGRDIVLFCGYHGWHDWYLAANLSDDQALDGHLLPGLNPNGVPRGLKGSAHPFTYNDTGGFLSLMKRLKGRVGAVVMEPVRNSFPNSEFLETVRKVTRSSGIPLIIDEITAGFRLTCGGAHLVFGLEPDMAVFAKGMSNGFPMAAIIGKKAVMSAAQTSFISSTYWTEKIGPAAAIATIKKLRRHSVHEHLIRAGKKIKSGWAASARRHKISLEISGIDPLGHFTFRHAQRLVLKTLFTQEMLKHGFLATNAFYASYAHKDAHINRYLDAVDSVFGVIARAIASGKPKRYLKTEVCHAGFKRLT